MGFLTKWIYNTFKMIQQNRFKNGPTMFEDSNENENLKSFDLDTLWSLFLIWTIGIFISSICFGLEYCIQF